jgi:hypothetical protein
LNNAEPFIRQLGLADRGPYFQLRLRGLKAHPELFGQSYDEALAKGPTQHDTMLEGVHAAEGSFLLGAYLSADTPLIGVVGLAQPARAGAPQGLGHRHVRRAGSRGPWRWPRVAQ